MISGRSLSRDEIALIWSDIDRSEVIDEAYRVENGSLELERVQYDLAGWPPGEAEQYMPILETCHDRGGGSESLYVSATRSKHTIDFYRQQGCTLATEPDPALFELEPEDIHLDCVIE